MLSPIALQLYSVREYMQENFDETVRKVADMGYAGVEPAGFPGTTPLAAGKLFSELGLAVPSAHLPIPVGEYKNEVLEAMAAIGSQRCISGKGPGDFDTIDKIKETCAIFNMAADNARGAGLTFGLHNHWWEFLQVEGRFVYQVMLEELDPDIFFELDTYWIQTAGVDPAEVTRELGPRVPILHIKDGPCVQKEPMTAVGDGVMDFHAIIEAGVGHTEWLIVELDRCATDMMVAVERSVKYLVGEGLGSGKS
ncbi:MAG: sugar phosphate isomerase/epimerase [Anaerolineales bacterium]|nr:MAG: sugar phosphate isomerase/epimerase [Anaerolineales bacterium]